MENTQTTSLLPLITPNTIAIIWVGAHHLNSFPKYFLEIDYLLDGQLKRYVNNEEASAAKTYEVSLFVNKHFSSNLYVLYFLKSKNTNDKEIISKLNSLIEIIKREIPEKQNIVVLSPDEKSTGEEILNYLKKNLPQSHHALITS